MLNNGFSLEGFFGGTVNNTQKSTGLSSNQQTVRYATESQKTLYLSLCDRKNVQPNPQYETFTIAEMSAEIERINAIKKVVMASDKQKEKIIELVGRLAMPMPNVDKLTIESASKLIGQLIELDKKSANARASEQQIKFLHDISICPDVMMWELAEVPEELIFELSAKKKLLTIAFNDKMYESAKQIENEIVELQNRIANYQNELDYNKLPKEIVSAFIEKYKNVYYNWKNSRLSPEQASLIKEFQSRLGDVVLTDLELVQFSKKEADEYIKMLQRNIADKEVVFTEKTIDDKVARSTTDIVKANERTQEKLVELIHKLYATIGQDADELVDDTYNDDKVIDLMQFVSQFGVTADDIKEMASGVFTDEEIDVALGLA